MYYNLNFLQGRDMQILKPPKFDSNIILCYYLIVEMVDGELQVEILILDKI